ncbi:DUF2917 domain-containing protein [Variovorax rhizosphaerae]|uniref:DUF2917 domain-containing protein n=1 Tax=Variovorax rhizosphaerae TaxID=1836200 RepID=A0ABU8WPE7_9BURK
MNNHSANLSATVSSAFQMGLPAHAVYSVGDASEVRITCRSGSVWITLDDDPVDTVLEPGEQFTTPLHRRALVSALEASCIAVAPAAERKVAMQATPYRTPALHLRDFLPA